MKTLDKPKKVTPALFDLPAPSRRLTGAEEAEAMRIIGETSGEGCYVEVNPLTDRLAETEKCFAELIEKHKTLQAVAAGALEDLKIASRLAADLRRLVAITGTLSRVGLECARHSAMERMMEVSKEAATILQSIARNYS